MDSSQKTRAQDEARWAQVMTRQDAPFRYAVKTTGVYCRPSCSARRPLRKNVEFYDNGALAQEAGYRSCKRCRPDESAESEDARRVTAMCELMQKSPRQLTLAELAAHVGLSAAQAGRIFLRITGLSPKKYGNSARRARLEREIGAQPSVTAAMYAAGYESPSAFYEDASKTLGMSPAVRRRRAEGETIRFAVGRCSFGEVLVAATERGICAVSLGDDAEELVHELEHKFGKANLLGAEQDFESIVAQVIALVEAGSQSEAAALRLDLRGTVFQEKVWSALREIPSGETRSYTELAQAIGSPTAVRAVAGACAGNSIAVLIPCHRVIRTDGSLSGYRWGIERKRELLARERD